jgi:hypothetical protein
VNHSDVMITTFVCNRYPSAPYIPVIFGHNDARNYSLSHSYPYVFCTTSVFPNKGIAARSSWNFAEVWKHRSITGSSEQIQIRFITVRLLDDHPQPKKIHGVRTVADVCDILSAYYGLGVAVGYFMNIFDVGIRCRNVGILCVRM